MEHLNDPIIDIYGMAISAVFILYSFVVNVVYDWINPVKWSACKAKVVISFQGGNIYWPDGC